MAKENAHATMDELLEEVLYVWSVPRGQFGKPEEWERQLLEASTKQRFKDRDSEHQCVIMNCKA
jgi:hypothetical protein